MTVVPRTNNFDFDRPPLEFGIEWVQTEPDPVASLTRLGDATTMAVNTASSPHVSDFSRYYPWLGMKRYYMNSNGDVLAAVDEPDLPNTEEATWTEDALRVLVRIPYFFTKTVRISSTVIQFWLSPYPLKGYRLHQAFLRWNYTGSKMRVTDVYVGAYEAETTTPQKSIANVTPKTSYTRANFRSNFAAIGTGGYQPLDFLTWNALQWLELIEYGGLDSQTPSGSTARGGLSKGITNDTAVEKTGWTSSVDVNEHGFHSIDLGNLSGQVQCNTISGLPVYACSFHGVENPLGNTATILDGVNINTDGFFWISNTLFADQTSFASPYWKIAFYIGLTAGYIKFLGTDAAFEDLKNDLMFGGNYLALGGSATTYMCDYYDAPANLSVPRFPIVGGAYSTGSLAGIFELNCQAGYADTYVNVGSRLMQVPLDIDFWKY